MAVRIAEPIGIETPKPSLSSHCKAVEAHDPYLAKGIHDVRDFEQSIGLGFSPPGETILRSNSGTLVQGRKGFAASPERATKLVLETRRYRRLVRSGALCL